MAVGSRGLALLIAEGLRAAHDRMLDLVDRHDRGEIDIDRLPLIPLGERTDEAVDVETKSTTPTRKKKAPVAKPPRFSSSMAETPAKRITSKALGNRGGGRKPTMCCGKTMEHAYKTIDDERIHYRKCLACGSSDLAGILRVREAKKRVEAKRAA